MADKSCKNCGYEGCPVDKGTTTCCDNWTPITPPTPDEAVEVVIECPDKNENCDKYRCDKCTARIRWDDGGVVKLKLNPNNSPKLVAWAKSKALEFVDKDTLRGALARAYCTKENENKELDPTLIEEMVNEIIKLKPR